MFYNRTFNEFCRDLANELAGLVIFVALAAAVLAALTFGLATAAEPLETAAKAAETIRGKVVAVADGDTITVLTADKIDHKIRLAAIDAPEIGHGKNNPGQPHGVDAKQSLSEKVFGKTVDVELGPQTYDRRVGRVTIDGDDVSEYMLGHGQAWFYAAYSKDKHLAEVEKAARKAKIGLWADKSPTPPWQYRKDLKAAAAQRKATQAK